MDISTVCNGFYGRTMRKFFMLALTLATVMLLNGCAILNTATPANDTTGLYSDDKARASIITALHNKDARQANDLKVLCFDGTAFVLGHAEQDFQNYAINTARKTPGVNDVITHWFAKPPANAMMDASIAANIDSAIFLDKELTSTRMAVEVFDGHVVLCGVMRNKSNVDKAIEIARRVNNVKSVTSYLKY